MLKFILKLFRSLKRKLFRYDDDKYWNYSPVKKNVPGNYYPIKDAWGDR